MSGHQIPSVSAAQRGQASRPRWLPLKLMAQGPSFLLPPSAAFSATWSSRLGLFPFKTNIIRPLKTWRGHCFWHFLCPPKLRFRPVKWDVPWGCQEEPPRPECVNASTAAWQRGAPRKCPRLRVPLLGTGWTRMGGSAAPRPSVGEAAGLGLRV